MRKLIFGLACIGSALVMQSCDSDDDNVSKTPKEKVVSNYAEIVSASYEDSYDLAKQLSDKIDDFLANPTEAKFETAKQAWYDAREPYGQTEAYRFSGGPIDTGSESVEGMLNAWPLDESFIDYVNTTGDSGVNLINNVTDYPELSKDLLRDLNESTKSSITLGYHAIEFLLWGQDTVIPTAGEEHTTGGNRPYTDYVDGGTASHQDRRRQYLKIATELLLEDLEYVVEEWDNDGNNYRDEFESMEADNSLSRALAGIAVLAGSELAEERILVAVAEQSQEDEHSCFSDNTHRDIYTNYEGVKNVFLGEYKRVDGSTVEGKSFYDLLKKEDEAKAEAITDSFETIEDLLASTTIPFDYGITLGSDAAIYNDVVAELRALSNKFAEAAVILEIGTYSAPE